LSTTFSETLTNLKTSSVVHFTNQTMPDLNSAATPDQTLVGYQAGGTNFTNTLFATSSRTRGFMSFLRETLRTATESANWVVGGGLNPAYTQDAALAVKHKPTTTTLPAAAGNVWQAWTAINAVNQLQTLQTDPAFANSVVFYDNLTRIFRTRELFANVRPEGPSSDEEACGNGGQTGSQNCGWNFDRAKAIYDKLGNRFLILVRSVNILYPGDPVGDLGRLYLAVSETSDVAGNYRLFRITPASVNAGPGNPVNCLGQYPQLDSPALTTNKDGIFITAIVVCNTPGYPSTTTFKSSIIMAFRKSDLYASQFTQPANSINYLMWTGAQIAASVPPVTPPAVAFKAEDCFQIQPAVPQSEVDSQRDHVLFVCQDILQYNRVVLISLMNTAALSGTGPLTLSSAPSLKANFLDKGFTFRPNYKTFDSSYVAEVRMPQFALLNSTGPLLPGDGGFRTPGVAYANGQLYFVRTELARLVTTVPGLLGAELNSIYWARVDPNNATSGVTFLCTSNIEVQARGMIVSGNQLHLSYPSVSVTANGAAYIIYSYAGSELLADFTRAYPGVAQSVILASANPTTNIKITVQASAELGQQTVPGYSRGHRDNAIRWGQYGASQVVDTATSTQNLVFYMQPFSNNNKTASPGASDGNIAPTAAVFVGLTGAGVEDP